MGKSKNKQLGGGFVYSTDPTFSFEEAEQELAPQLPPAQQLVKVQLQTKNRGNKAVSVILNLQHTDAELENIAKKLKTFFGTGGAVKDGEIVIQGDQRDKIVQWLHQNQYTKAKKI